MLGVLCNPSLQRPRVGFFFTTSFCRLLSGLILTSVAALRAQIMASADKVLHYSRLVCNVVVEVRVLDYGYVAVVQVEHVPVLVGLALSHRREIWLLI